MTRFDLSPLFRTTVGFDSLAHMLDSMTKQDDQAIAYPPYNIEKCGDDRYRISLAVAGFGEDDLSIVAQDNALAVSGKIATKTADEGKNFLHRGIASRSFERRFQLADHIRVAGASLDKGVLHIDLVREVPETMKPRSIKISTISVPPKPVLDHSAA